MSQTSRQVVFGVLFLGILGLVGTGLWKTLGSDPVYVSAKPRRLDGVMGTQCKLLVVVRGDHSGRIDDAYAAAEQALRNVEARMSMHLEASELSVLNAAPAGQLVPLAPETVELLKRCHTLTGRTDGAFDPTAKPLFDLWRRAAEADRPPTDEQLSEALAAGGWEHYELFPRQADGAIKRRTAAEIDLGGVAKGHAVDRAVEALRAGGAAGGLVNVGGDLRCFGHSADGAKWTVGIQDPFDPEAAEPAFRLLVSDAAVCTSGNYRRWFEVAGERHSHIIDPRTGRPADAVPSVTVVAADAVTADAWATALSVLGPAGLPLVERQESVEALIVSGDEENYGVHLTTGFAAFLVDPPEEPKGEPAVASARGSR
jgi:thiamine biosynthesis lipoprotein